MMTMNGQWQYVVNIVLLDETYRMKITIMMCLYHYSLIIISGNGIESNLHLCMTLTANTFIN